MSNLELRSRQIHLDFHTSEKIENIAEEFDPEEFASILEKAHVNSVNLFARCHHGWLYYKSKKFPERIHPHLKRPNLLNEQIEICHKREIKVSVYSPIQWDYYTAERHPEWLTMTSDGKQEGTRPYEAGFYRSLCINTPYSDFIKEHIAELLESIPVDGLWLDIVQPKDCSCYYCRQLMLAECIEPSDISARKQFGLDSITKFKLDLTDFIRQFNKDCLIHYNAGHISVRERQALKAFTHFEIESIASGGWGYLHFPVTMRYARTFGKECVGMTGKFHTWWGDFHSFKNPSALEYECFRMLALNAKCSIGDQLHPSGKLCLHTYELIGSVYSQIEKKEPWCTHARPLVDIGLYNPEEIDVREPWDGLWPSILGAVRMLQESGHQFDIIDLQADFYKYKLIILPDNITVSPELNAKLQCYILSGGSVIASFVSGMNTDKNSFIFDELGVECVSEGPIDSTGAQARGKSYFNNDFSDYVRPDMAIGKGLQPTDYVMYIRGVHIKAKLESKILANCIAPYFDRSYKHFCSHQQAPSSGRISQPAVVKNGRAIYFAHPVFTIYYTNAPLWVKKMVVNAIGMLLPDPLLKHDGPSMINTAINAQEKQNRWVLHLLNYVPEMRCKKMEVVEDVVPYFDVNFSVRTERPVKAIKCVPQSESLEFEYSRGLVSFKVPRIEGHQMVEIAFDKRGIHSDLQY